MDRNNTTDLEATRKRTYFSCWNEAHEGLVRQTFFTEPGKYSPKCIGCGAVMTIGRYTSEVNMGWLKVNKAGVVEAEVRFLDNIQMKFVMKIQGLIRDAEAGTVPKELVDDLKAILEDYLFERIKTLGDLRKRILAQAVKAGVNYLSKDLIINLDDVKVFYHSGAIRNKEEI